MIKSIYKKLQYIYWAITNPILYKRSKELKKRDPFTYK